MEEKVFSFDGIKASDPQHGLGIFEGYVAVFGNVDSSGEIIDRGAFKKTLLEKKQKKTCANGYLFPVLWQHNEKEPIGGFTDAFEDHHGLFVRGEIDVNTPQGSRAYSGMRKGYLRGLSIGYETIKAVWDPRRVKHLTEVRLWEGSLVSFPANTRAQVLAVKHAQQVTSVGGDVTPDAIEALWDRRVPVKQGNVTPEDLDALMRGYAREVGHVLGLPARAQVELSRLEVASLLDKEPGTRDAGHLSWAVRQARRDEERRRWEAELL